MTAADLDLTIAVHSIGARTREWIVAPPACPALRRHGILLAGVSEAQQGFRFVRPQPTETQVLITCAGSGRVLVDGAWRETAPGDGYLTPMGAAHAYHAVPRQPWTVCWAMFRGEALPPAPTLLRVDHRPLHDVILNLHREVLGGNVSTVAGEWAALLDLLLRRAIAPGLVDHRLGRLWEDVDASLDHPWTLAEMAEVAGIGSEQLRRLCRRHYGRSPMAQVIRLRMRRAAGLLASGQPVGAVAAAVGYANAFAFSAAFRREMGQPPSLVARR